MYPLCTTCAFAIIIYIWIIYVFPCALLVYSYDSLNECDLSFHFWNVTLMICMVKLTCSFDFIDFWHLTLICIDDIYDKYYVWPLTFDWRQFWWVHLQFTSGHEFK